MVFKRRDKRSWWKVIADFIYPKGGWSRAFQYVQHRLHRLPDPPHKIARGIWAGVFTTFTPFYGLHFVVAAIIARVMQGNIIAALLATFFGNPLTYIPIGVASLKTGHWLLGTEFEEAEQHLGEKFAKAGGDLWQNFIAVVTGAPTDWHGLQRFYDEVFFPYLVGGIIPGIVAASVCYYLAVPVIRVYQNRRKGRIKDKLARLRKKPKGKTAD
ncbi:MAG: DUF2062 domain-containing protein [Spiribacter salinus]|uniref:DUF2062 domain-containing protein n=1 Tax=Spiribacter salinus TaxID=1335746 RepID=A0A540VUH0_9GAMM|nr:MAG: DUF2062 domain-containing protein [Spiribacter salinus]